MKRGLTLLLASLMLAAALTACGGDTRQDNNQKDDAMMNGGAQNDTSGSGQNGGGLMDDMQDGVNDVIRGTENAMDDMTGGRDSVSDQKLRSGPAWNGNLQRPDFPVNPNSVL